MKVSTLFEKLSKYSEGRKAIKEFNKVGGKLSFTSSLGYVVVSDAGQRTMAISDKTSYLQAMWSFVKHAYDVSAPPVTTIGEMKEAGKEETINQVISKMVKRDIRRLEKLKKFLLEVLDKDPILYDSLDAQAVQLLECESVEYFFEFIERVGSENLTQREYMRRNMENSYDQIIAQDLPDSFAIY